MAAGCSSGSGQRRKGLVQPKQAWVETCGYGYMGLGFRVWGEVNYIILPAYIKAPTPVTFDVPDAVYYDTSGICNIRSGGEVSTSGGVINIQGSVFMDWGAESFEIREHLF